MSPEDANNRRRVNLSPRERSQLIAEALSDAARRMRFSTRGRRGLSFGGHGARPGQRIQQIAFVVSFIVLVAIPNIGAAIYYGLIASDQYAAEARFTVRGGRLQNSTAWPPSRACLQYRSSKTLKLF